MRIPEDLVDFLESGVAIVMATRDAYLAPEGLRVLGLRVGDDRTTLTAFLPAGASQRVLANLAHNGHAAFAISLPTTYRTYQVKGTYLGTRDEADPALVQRYLQLFSENIDRAGSVPGMTGGLKAVPCIAADFQVTDLFNQTPGAGAGARV